MRRSARAIECSSSTHLVVVIVVVVVVMMVLVDLLADVQHTKLSSGDFRIQSRAPAHTRHNAKRNVRNNHRTTTNMLRCTSHDRCARTCGLRTASFGSPNQCAEQKLQPNVNAR